MVLARSSLLMKPTLTIKHIWRGLLRVTRLPNGRLKPDVRSRWLVLLPALLGFLITSSSAEADGFGLWEFSKSCLASEGGSAELVDGGFKLTGADGGTCAGQAHWVKLEVIIPDGTSEVGFDWAYQTSDGAWYDPPQIILNGVITQLTDQSNATGSGLVTVEVGDVFAFRQYSTDSCCQPGLLTVTNLTLGLGEWVSTISSTTATTTSTSTVPPSTVPVTNPTTTTVQETTSTTSSLPQTSVPSTTTEPPQTSTTIQETVSSVTSTSTTTSTTVVQTTTPSSSSTTTPSSLPTTTSQAPTTTTSSLPPATTTTTSTSTTSLPQTITGTTTTTTVYIPPVTTTTELIVEPSTTTTTTEPEPAPTTTAKPQLETTTSTTTNPPTTTTTLPPVTTTQPNVTTTLQAPTNPTQPLTQTELLNTLQSLSEAPTEAIQGILTAVLTKELDTSQTTLLITTPAVLENITPTQAEQLFEQITPTELSPDEAEAVVAAVQEAPKEVREAFESTLNIFQGFADTYVPLNSTVPVGTRRALIAVGAVFLTVAPAPSRRIK